MHLFGTRVQLGPKGKTMCLKRFFLARSQKRHMGIDTDKQTTEELHQANIDHERLSPTLCQTTADDMVFIVPSNLHKSYQC
jgi:hypothetical protein